MKITIVAVRGIPDRPGRGQAEAAEAAVQELI